MHYLLVCVDFVFLIASCALMVCVKPWCRWVKLSLQPHCHGAISELVLVGSSNNTLLLSAMAPGVAYVCHSRFGGPNAPFHALPRDGSLLNSAGPIPVVVNTSEQVLAQHSPLLVN